MIVRKPLWLEGMLVRPQHFQQFERYLELQGEARLDRLLPFQWGVRTLTIDPSLLPVGEFGLTACAGVFPDGTAFQAPDRDLLPPTRTVPEGSLDRRVFLALPVRRSDGTDVDRTPVEGPATGRPAAASAGQGGPGLVRYLASQAEVRDTTDPLGESATLMVGALRPRLLFEGEAGDDLIRLPIARIKARDETGNVTLVEDFLPTVIDCAAAPVLSELIREIAGLLRYRGGTLAARVDPSGRDARVGGVADLLMLLTANRYAPRLTQLAKTPGIHPLTLFLTLLDLAGELSTFATSERLAPDFPAYNHDSLDTCLPPLVQHVRDRLSAVLEDAAIALPIEAKGYGVHVSQITDRALVRASRFVLAVGADLDGETIRRSFPPQAKMGPVEVIRDLVNYQLPGIILKPMPVAPRELPYRSDATYFELDRSGELWGRLERSAGFALHVSGSFPGLKLEFWAVPDHAAGGRR